MIIQFELNESQKQRLEEWFKEQDAKVVEIQKGSIFEELGLPIPYYGACGGEITYMFTPTSLGPVIKVRHGTTEEILDLTDYDDF